MKALLRFPYALAVLVFCSTFISAQTPELRTVAARFDSLEQIVLQHDGRVAALSASADSLAAIIAGRKTAGRGVLQDRALEAALHRADVLAEELQAAEVARDSAQQEIRRMAVRVLRYLTLRTRTLERELQQAEKRGDQALVPHLRRSLAAAGALRRRAEKWLQSENAAILLAPVHIAPGDSPGLLEEKADLLMDQADGLRRKARLLQQQVQQAEAEQRLHSRLQAFVEDVQLFDPLSESVGRGEGAGQESFSPELLDRAGRAVDKTGADENLLFSDELLLSVGLAELTGQAREEGLQSARARVQQMLFLADSLSARARDVLAKARAQQQEER